MHPRQNELCWLRICLLLSFLFFFCLFCNENWKGKFLFQPCILGVMKNMKIHECKLWCKWPLHSKTQSNYRNILLPCEDTFNIHLERCNFQHKNIFFFLLLPSWPFTNFELNHKLQHHHLQEIRNATFNTKIDTTFNTTISHSYFLSHKLINTSSTFRGY